MKVKNLKTFSSKKLKKSLPLSIEDRCENYRKIILRLVYKREIFYNRMVGFTIRYFRKNAKINEKRMSKILDIKPYIYHCIEGGRLTKDKHYFIVQSLLKFCEILNITLDGFYKKLDEIIEERQNGYLEYVLKD